MARIAALSIALYVNGVIIAISVASALFRAGVQEPRFGGGGVVGSAAAGAMVAFYVVFVAVAGVAGTVIAALLGRSRNEWRAATVGAALGLCSLFVAQSVVFNGALLAAAVAAVAVVAGAALFQPTHPARWALTLPAVALVGAVGTLLVRDARERAQEADTRYLWDLEELAERHDRAGLERAFASSEYARRKPPMESAIELLALRGDHLTEIELILRHPATDANPCIAILRAVLDGETAVVKNGRSWAPHFSAAKDDCAEMGMHIAARKGDGEVLAELVGWTGVQTAMNQPLYGLLKSMDFDAALRLVRAAGFLDEQGRVAAAAFDDNFLHGIYSHMDAPEQRTFFCEHADKDALLAAVAADSEYDDGVKRLLACGANANARLGCGATPLSAAAWGRADVSVLRALLNAGASANAPGAPYCVGPRAKRAPAAPLWILAQRWQEGRGSFDEHIRLLLDSGADAAARGPNGETLVSVFEKDPDRADLLLHLKRPTASSPR